MIVLVVVFCALFLLSCASQHVVELPLPEPLVLEKINSDSLSCLSDEAYRKLVERDILLQERLNTLRKIIESTG